MLDKFLRGLGKRWKGALHGERFVPVPMEFTFVPKYVYACTYCQRTYYAKRELGWRAPMPGEHGQFTCGTCGTVNHITFDKKQRG